ncbi:unnamed protein product [Protopolystoma xenopodis]|uniref:PDZ domain-containing protein n=1 Tax=Protopolystoma xenopodis TaxID=117903 RepID=A0A448X617_9PLAT|nr:unnamed protein product [Protopolystoma xenopodis]
MLNLLFFSAITIPPANDQNDSLVPARGIFVTDLSVQAAFRGLNQIRIGDQVLAINSVPISSWGAGRLIQPSSASTSALDHNIAATSPTGQGKLSLMNSLANPARELQSSSSNSMTCKPDVFETLEKTLGCPDSGLLTFARSLLTRSTRSPQLRVFRLPGNTREMHRLLKHGESRPMLYNYFNLFNQYKLPNVI